MSIEQISTIAYWDTNVLATALVPIGTDGVLCAVRFVVPPLGNTPTYVNMFLKDSADNTILDWAESFYEDTTYVRSFWSSSPSPPWEVRARAPVLSTANQWKIVFVPDAAVDTGDVGVIGVRLFIRHEVGCIF